MKFLATEGAPKAIGPYSQGVVEGGFLFCSGQIPLDPDSGQLVSGGIEASTERVLDNMEAVLKSAAQGGRGGNGLDRQNQVVKREGVKR